MFLISGIEDSRYLCRGRINWIEVEKNLINQNSKQFLVFNDLKKKIFIRSKLSSLHNGTLEFISFKNLKNEIEKKCLSYKRISLLKEEEILFIHNLSSKTIEIKIDFKLKSNICLLGGTFNFLNGILTIDPFDHYWIEI